MENSKIKNILVIDNHDSFVYNLVQILRENEHCQFDIVYNDQIDFSSLEPLRQASCYPPDREFQPRPENFSHSSSIVKPLTTSSVYASATKPSPNPSVPACNNCLSPNTATKVPSPSSIPPTFSTTASPIPCK